MNISAGARRWGINRGLLNVWRGKAGLTSALPIISRPVLSGVFSGTLLVGWSFQRVGLQIKVATPAQNECVRGIDVADTVTRHLIDGELCCHGRMEPRMVVSLPLHPNGGYAFRRHGSYARLTSPGVRIARYYWPQGHMTFSSSVWLAHCCLSSATSGPSSALATGRRKASAS